MKLKDGRRGPLSGRFTSFPNWRREGQYYASTAKLQASGPYLDEETDRHFREFRILYDTVIKILFNFRQSGHPGGAISVGPQLCGLFLDVLRYDISRPDDGENDVLGLASGHKANGLYAILSLLFETVRLREPSLLPPDAILFEDLLGFRRNRTYRSRLVDLLHPKALDGHPTPETPFVRIASGASGYAVSQLLGLSLALRERFPGDDPPRVFILEGDGASTTGRFHEAWQAAHNLRLGNVLFLYDYNNACIDEDRVIGTADGGKIRDGRVASWIPEELARIHGGNVVSVEDGHDMNQVLAGLDQLERLLKKSLRFPVGVFHTIKGKGYDPAGGATGRKFHGAGHRMDSPEYFASQREFEEAFNTALPRMPEKPERDTVEEHFLKSLETVREVLRVRTDLSDFIFGRIKRAQKRLPRKRRISPADARPLVERVPGIPLDPMKPPEELLLKPGRASFRKQFVEVLGHLHRITKGAIFIISADLVSSTLPDIASRLGAVPGGEETSSDYVYRPRETCYGEDNRQSRILHGGGITEDANSGLALGICAEGHYTALATSYGAFQSLAHTHVRVANAPLDSPERRHRIPAQIGAFHASLWTGPDGVRTHADPQALSTWRENFPYGGVVTLVPIDPAEIFSLLLAAYRARPTAIIPFIPRPDGSCFDRGRLGFSPAEEASRGGYLLRPAREGRVHGTVVLQGAGVAGIFIESVLPELDRRWNLSIAAITSHELFRMQSPGYRDMVLPFSDRERTRRNCLAITEYTEGTIRPYVDETGLRHSLFSYRPPGRGGCDANEKNSAGPYGSGEPGEIFKEACLDAESQFQAVTAYLEKINS